MKLNNDDVLIGKFLFYFPTKRLTCDISKVTSFFFFFWVKSLKTNFITKWLKVIKSNYLKVINDSSNILKPFQLNSGNAKVTFSD